MSSLRRGVDKLLPYDTLHLYMDTSTLQKIEQQLRAEKGKLESQLAQISTKNIHNPEDYQATFPQFGEKEEDNATEVAQYSDNLTLERTLEAALRDTKKALENIKKGRYGTCKYCKKPIDERRLLARPTSASCITCKKQLTQEVWLKQD